MARPWEYPGWRRIAMQGVMWVIFAGTLGLAAMVTHHRNYAPPVTLAEPIRFGALNVRLPAGWEIHQSRTQLGWRLHAAEPDSGRELGITEIARGGYEVTPAGVVSARLLDFKGLHQVGKMMVVRAAQPTPNGIIRFDRLDGEVVLPNGLMVILRLDQGNSLRPGPADSRLLEQIAAGITLATADGSSLVGGEISFPEVRVGTADDSADLEEQDGTLYVNLHAAGPTGGAKLVRRSAWPGKIVLRFVDVEGVGSLDVSNGRVLLQTSSDPGSQPELHRLGAGDESSDAMPFDPNYQTPVEATDRGVEIALPPAMYSTGVRELRLHWILTR